MQVTNKETCYIKHVTSNSNMLLKWSNKHNTVYNDLRPVHLGLADNDNLASLQNTDVAYLIFWPITFQAFWKAY